MLLEKLTNIFIIVHLFCHWIETGYYSALCVTLHFLKGMLDYHVLHHATQHRRQSEGTGSRTA